MKFKYIHNAIILLFVLAFSACKPAAQEKTSGIVNERISIEAAKELMDSNKELKIIDVRTPGEFASGHLENAVNIDFRNDDFQQKIAELDRNESYLIYCKSGGRSGQALDLMKELNFIYVKEMKDGYSGYVKNN